jgi:hypothetical protein
VYYIGTVLDDAGNNAVLGRIIQELGLANSAQMLPEGVEMSARSGKDYTVRFLLNLTKSPQAVVLGGADKRDVLTGELLSGKVNLEAGAVRIYLE